MASQSASSTGIAAHGAARLPSVEVESFNSEAKDGDGFLGDRASRGAFRDILEKWRKTRRKSGQDPFGAEPSESVSKKALDAALVGDDVEAAAVVHSAIEEFAQELAYVTRRFLKTKAWQGTTRIVVGGGFRASRLGELAIARTEIILRAEGFDVDMAPIRFHPDDAGLVGAAHLAPAWIFHGYGSLLAIDIGGTNVRCGLVETRFEKAADLSSARVHSSELWRHADEDPTREGIVKRLVKMLKDLIAISEKDNLRLAPFIGVACPGVIKEDGSIEKGAQNLPGKWESSRFNLPASLIEAIPQIGGHDTAIVMHNDGVVQGLSEIPFMQDVKRWGVLTIGTGLGNACFTNRNPTVSGKRGTKEARETKSDA